MICGKSMISKPDSTWGERKLYAIRQRRDSTGDDYMSALEFIERTVPEFSGSHARRMILSGFGHELPEVIRNAESAQMSREGVI